MAKTSSIEKWKSKKKFEVREYTRCHACGRTRSVYRKFKLCRICLRLMGLRGLVPGLMKASW